jgi:hypothetical protein
MKFAFASYATAVFLGVGALFFSVASYAETFPKCPSECPEWKAECDGGAGQENACAVYYSECESCNIPARSGGTPAPSLKIDLNERFAWAKPDQVTLAK